jgi:hypothetical protein
MIFSVKRGRDSRAIIHKYKFWLAGIASQFTLIIAE